MAKRLLQRQTELIEYLTSGAAIFGDGGGQTSAPDGFEPTLLRVEAWFSHRKRLGKIRAVLAKTFEILGDAGDDLARDFAEACPPASISRLDNARQFHGFLTDRWRRSPPDPPYLADVAVIELARAEATAASIGAEPDRLPNTGVRRAAGVILLRCAYDVRAIFETAGGCMAPVQRDTPLAVALPPGAEHPTVLEVLPAVFELLSALDTFTDLTAFGPASEIGQLVDELTDRGLVERGRCA